MRTDTEIRSIGKIAGSGLSSRCLGCGRGLPAPFLDLGRTPLANAYIDPAKAGEPEATYPLAVAYCPDCHLVQLSERVAPEEMFSEYLYFSSFSQSFLRHAEAMVGALTDRFDLNANSLVLEIASNDGYLLQYFKQKGVPVLGVEPARNIAAEAQKRGIPTLNRFFSLESAKDILVRHGASDVIIGNNVLAHVPDINDFLSGVRDCLKPTGVAVFEFPYLGDFLENIEFDTIYHEHVFYYSLTAIGILARRAGLELFDVAHQAVHGGSLRVFLQRPGTRPVATTVGAMLADEAQAGFITSALYQTFSVKVEGLRRALLAVLGKHKSAGKRLAAYGAAAKGNTLLNYCGIGKELLEFTVDRSPHKQGKVLPGSRIPVRPAEDLVREMPDYTVILPWNFADEIIGQQQEYLRKGGRFIIPVPMPREVSL
ncbi:MAG: class I SAM-dependent methyltransferase [Elusimicrobiota bacterium]|mgnify:CR=1 FL=1